MRDAVAGCGMDEDEFRAFHEKTARPLRAYLVRLARDRALADDLLQETYLRFLAAQLPNGIDDGHRRNYLYRIATNLLRDHFRKEKIHAEDPQSDAIDELPAEDRMAEGIEARRDVTRVLDRLRPKERQLLWLAYVERFSHKEIAEIVGFKPDSVRPVLFRARQKLAAMLRRRGLRP